MHSTLVLSSDEIFSSDSILAFGPSAKYSRQNRLHLQSSQLAHTFNLHSHIYAFLITAILALVARILLNRTVAVIAAEVLCRLSDTSSEE